jgi:hypothetical protein
VAFNTAGSDTSAAVVVMTERLVGHWKLNNDLTDSIDDEIPGVTAHDGVALIPNYDTGIDGGALNIADANNLVEITGSGDFFNFYPQGYTISAWCKRAPTIAGWGAFVSKQGLAPARGFILIHDEDGGASHTLRDVWGNLTGTVDVDTDSWHLVTGTYDSTAATNQGKLYVDGIQIAQVTKAAIAATSSAPLIFGHEQVEDPTIGLYTGLLDDIRIWSYPLDNYEVAHLYTDLETAAKICVNRPSMDISGPGGAPDCIVNLFDFAAVAGQWLDCDVVPDCR